MQADVADHIEKRARFVAGRRPWFRGKRDATADSAVRDVKFVLDRLPAKVREPQVSGGTTANPDTVIVLSWLTGGYTTIKSVSVSFKGSNRCDVYWDKPPGGAEQRKDISVDEVIKLELPQKIDDLINRAPGATPAGPAI